MLRVVGTVLSPVEGEVLNHVSLLVQCIASNITTLPNSFSPVECDSSGGYDFVLREGVYRIYIKYSTDTPTIPLGECTVASGMPEELTLNNLITNYTPQVPDWITDLDSKWTDTWADFVTDNNTQHEGINNSVSLGDAKVVEDMSVYINDVTGQQGATLREEISVGDVGVFNQSTAYTDALGTQIAQDITVVQNDVSTVSQTLTAHKDATGVSFSEISNRIDTNEANLASTITAEVDSQTGAMQLRIEDVISTSQADLSSSMSLEIDEKLGTLEADIVDKIETDDAALSSALSLEIDEKTGTLEASLTDKIETDDAALSSAMSLEIDTKTGTLEASLTDKINTENALIQQSIQVIDDGLAEVSAAWQVVATVGELTSAIGMKNDGVNSEIYLQADAVKFLDPSNPLDPLAPVFTVKDSVLNIDGIKVNGHIQATTLEFVTPAAIPDEIDNSTAVSEANAYANANFVDQATYGLEIAEIQKQVDKSITSWFGTETPTSTNYPASSWTTDEERGTHLGDLYYDNAAGKSYRWTQDLGVFGWVRIVDSSIDAALAAAAAAQDTADGKRRVFFAQPVAPYDRGDLWDTGSGLRRADVASTTTFQDSHWLWASDANGAADNAELAAKNHADAQLALEAVRADAYADGVADSAELAAIAAAQAKADLAEQNAKIHADGIVTDSEAATKQAYESYADAAEAAATITAAAYADGIVSDEEARAIADAQAKADQAEANANAAREAWNAENVYPDQTPLDIRGGGYDPDTAPNVGWGITSGGTATFNGNVYVNDGVVSGAIIVGAEIYGGSSTNICDPQNNGVDAGDIARRYDNHPDVPISCINQIEKTVVTGITVPTNTWRFGTMDTPVTFDIRAAADTSGSISTQRFLWGEIAANSMKTWTTPYINSSTILYIDNSYGCRYHIELVDVETGATLAEGYSPSVGIPYGNTGAERVHIVTVAGVPWRTIIHVDWQVAGGRCRVQRMICSNDYAEFNGKLGQPALNGIWRVTMEYGNPIVTGSGWVTVNQTMEIDVNNLVQP